MLKITGLREVIVGLLFILLFPGCATVAGPVNTHYPLNAGSSEGMVVFSIKCIAKPGEMKLLIVSDNSSQAYEAPFVCHPLSERNKDVDLLAMHFAPGTYHFSTVIKQGVFVDLYMLRYKPVTFTVKPGVVSYLGRQVLLGRDDQLPLLMGGTNAQNKDIPEFKRLMPQVTAPIEIQKTRLIR